jgi:hypothetical protein
MIDRFGLVRYFVKPDGGNDAMSRMFSQARVMITSLSFELSQRSNRWREIEVRQIAVSFPELTWTNADSSGVRSFHWRGNMDPT